MITMTRIKRIERQINKTYEQKEFYIVMVEGKNEVATVNRDYIFL